ncbi:MAG: DUF4340 domain-containing protein [Victivallales bacterium]|nr:DUF4340 domain-containing protein [Victivallales bacterium]
MKTKQLLVLIAVAVLLAVVAILKNRKNDATWRESRSLNAETILPDSFDTEKIASIIISHDGTACTLQRAEKGWKVQERAGYPANINDLSQFIVDLSQTRVAQTLSLSKDQAADLKLEGPDAVKVQLLDAAGKQLAIFLFGKKLEREAPQGSEMNMYGMAGNVPVGRYLLLPNCSFALVSNTFSLVDNQAIDWCDKEFFKISALKTGTLSRDDEPLWSVSRNGQSDELSLLGEIPAEKEIDSSKLASIKNAFSWIHFNDVAPASAPAKSVGMEKTKVFTATDFDGFVYVITLGEPVDSKQYLKVQVSWNGATKREPVKDEKPEDAAKADEEFAKKVKENQDKAASLNERLSSWYYEVGTSSLAGIDVARDALLKDKPKPAPAPDPKAPTPPAPTPSPAN